LLSHIPVALRARVTNGATFFGETSFAERDRRLFSFATSIFVFERAAQRALKPVARGRS
jgi:hypothetical protein